MELTQNLGNKDALDLARYVESTYGSLGKDLIQMLSEAIDKPLPEPSAKEASAFASPGTSFTGRLTVSWNMATTGWNI